MTTPTDPSNAGNMTEQEVTITAETRYTGRIFWAVLVGVVTAAVWATKIDARLASIEEQLTLAGSDRWQGYDMGVWVSSLDQNTHAWIVRLREDNPELKISDLIVPGSSTK